MAEYGPPDGQVKLQRLSLGEQIADVIRRDIIYGRLPAGQRVSQQQLCERYGTSRMPVRDALRHLTLEGFFKDDGSGHSVVAPFSRSDIEDIYLIEGMLHGLAIRRIVERGNPSELAELQDLHKKMVAAEEAGRPDEMADLNWRFHRRINQLARSPKLIAVLRTHSLSIPRDYLLEFPQWIPRANEEHGELLQVMRRGDADLAQEMMKEHVVTSGEGLINYLDFRGVDLDSDSQSAAED